MAQVPPPDARDTHDFLVVPCTLTGKLTLIKNDALVTATQPKLALDLHLDQVRGGAREGSNRAEARQQTMLSEGARHKAVLTHTAQDMRTPKTAVSDLRRQNVQSSHR